MAKTIVFEYEGTNYTLEYTRKTVELMERQGFVARDIATKPMSTLPSLFAGAFLAHHKFVKKDTIDSIYEQMSDKETLIDTLAEMYNDTMETLMSEPEKGNLKWAVN